MCLKDSTAVVSQEESKMERLNAAQRITGGMCVLAVVGVAIGILFAPKSGKETRKELKNRTVNTIETIKDLAQKKVGMVKCCASNVAQEVSNTIQDAKEKTEDINKDIEEGYQDIKQDIHRTAENISKDLNKFL
jgi:gas vesicle protein